MNIYRYLKVMLTKYTKKRLLIKALVATLITAPVIFTSCQRKAALDIYKDLGSSDPTKRIKAIIAIAKEKDIKAVPLLVNRLEDEDENVRIAAIETLKELTGKDLGYRALDPLYKRAEAVKRWQEFLEKEYRPLQRLKDKCQDQKEEKKRQGTKK